MTFKSLEPNNIIITADNLEKSKASIAEILYRVLAQSLGLPCMAAYTRSIMADDLQKS